MEPSRQKTCERGERPEGFPTRLGPWEHRMSLSPPRVQASCVQYRLVVREVRSLQILQLYTCLDQIQHVEWSADSLFILCAMYKRGLVQVRGQAPSP